MSDEVEGSGTAVEPSYVVETPSSGNEGSSEGQQQQQQSDQVRGSLAYSQPLAITGPPTAGNSAASTEGGGQPGSSSGTEIAVPSRSVQQVFFSFLNSQIYNSQYMFPIPTF